MPSSIMTFKSETLKSFFCKLYIKNAWFIKNNLVFTLSNDSHQYLQYITRLKSYVSFKLISAPSKDMLICECVENIMIHLYMWNIHICLKNNFEDIDIKAHYLLPNYEKKQPMR